MWISPASYEWLLPHRNLGISIDTIVEYAKTGQYPVIEDILYPALVYALLFGVLRMILTKFLFRVRLLSIRR
jgi:hypothetical protein